MECRKTIYCNIEGIAKLHSQKSGTEQVDDMTFSVKTVRYHCKQLVSPDRSFYYIEPSLENETKSPLKIKIEVRRLYPK